MTFLVIIGMLAILALGAVFLIAGLQLSLVSIGFTGKLDLLAFIPLVFGGLLIWLACYLAPFAIVVKVTT